MSWKDHMQVAAQATVTDYDGEDYTRLTFRPDLSLFKCKTISSDMLSLFKKRAYDLAGILDKKVAVTLNGQRIKIQSFLEYTDLYELEGDNHPRTHEIVSSRWEVVATVSEGQFMQASFVNGICTGRGGTHVNLVADQITEKLAEHIKKKNKDLNLKPFQIKNNLAVFVNCLIENPAFDSQTKETLMTRTEDFGSECVLSEKFIKDILKSGVVDFIVSQARAKERVKVQKALSGKKSQRVLGIPKLEDANLAGSKDSRHCQLILTEGDSAKALAMAGLGVVGRDKFGVFPLKGKLLNVRDANAKTLKENVEIQAIVKILGLQFDRVYEDTDSLRYGGILIMADQDHDGSHIKGLIINFIHYFWPSLIKINSFLKEFVTPVIKAIKQGEDPISFFTINDYKQWSQNMLLEHPEKRYSVDLLLNR
jgi:DNA topoisomerase-2